MISPNIKLEDKTMLKGGLRKVAMAVMMVLTLGSVNLGYAGAVSRPKIGSYIIDRRSTDTFEIMFYGGEVARVGVSGDHDTDLDLYVYDIYGNLMAKDEDETDVCWVSWTPRRTGTYIIRVVNRGYMPNEYVIVTN